MRLTPKFWCLGQLTRSNVFLILYEILKKYGSGELNIEDIEEATSHVYKNIIPKIIP